MKKNAHWVAEWSYLFRIKKNKTKQNKKNLQDRQCWSEAQFWTADPLSPVCASPILSTNMDTDHFGSLTQTEKISRHLSLVNLMSMS